MKPIVLVVGVPAVGKTWICEQAMNYGYLYIPHDDFEERFYPDVLARSVNPTKPVIGEIPFGLSAIQKSLENRNLHVHPVFVVEDETELRRRWKERDLRNLSAIKGHLTRQETYRERAEELGSFIGNSNEVLAHLMKLAL